MSDVIEKLKEGDIYRWRYAEPDPKNDGEWGRYHCCSCIAIVKHGLLRDTYWYGGDGRHFGLDEVPKLKLEYVGNLSELDRAREYQADYYDDDDIVNLNHANSTSGNFYLRKGAQRSKAKMLEAARRKLERSESDKRMAADLSARLREQIARIEAGDTGILIG